MLAPYRVCVCGRGVNVRAGMCVWANATQSFMTCMEQPKLLLLPTTLKLCGKISSLRLGGHDYRLGYKLKHFESVVLFLIVQYNLVYVICLSVCLHACFYHLLLRENVMQGCCFREETETAG